jgi:lipopolysaccharide/colanic/teichoic acid biosynthesis glycosyltransferase/proline dehydrogenase
VTRQPPREDVEQPGALRSILGRVAGNSKVRKAAMSTPFVRGLAWRFVAGENLEAGLAAARALNERGLAATLNLVGTHTRQEVDAVAAADGVLAAIDGIAAAGVRSHVSLKLTLIGLDVDLALCRRLLQRILDRASQAGVFLRIDMEESAYVETTLGLFEEAISKYGADRVGIVLQSYLRGRRDDVPRLAAAGASIRLVRGGYWESSDVVFATREEIDEAFFADIETLVRDGVRPAIATHDERSIEVAKRAVATHGRAPEDIEFQLLLGVRGDIAASLAAEGWRVRCYVPYGGQWYAYALGCIRRLPVTLVAEAKSRTRRPRPSPAVDVPARPAPSGARRRAGLSIKRLLDITGALVGFVVLGPVIAWTAVGVAASMGFPVLFRQRRPGKDERPITVVKFRTMRPPRKGERWFTSDADRVTRLGRFMRASSLDELPELWNVLRGEMSLVGPRPLLTEYLPHYTDRERLRHAMRPGVTGWAAVSGRHTLGFEERLELDAWYVEHWSLALDLRILLLTIGQVLSRAGVRETQDMAEIDFPARFLNALKASPDNDPSGSKPA